MLRSCGSIISLYFINAHSICLAFRKSVTKTLYSLHSYAQGNVDGRFITRYDSAYIILDDKVLDHLGCQILQLMG